MAAPLGKILLTNMGVFPPAGLSRVVMLNPRPSFPEKVTLTLILVIASLLEAKFKSEERPIQLELLPVSAG